MTFGQAVTIIIAALSLMFGANAAHAQAAGLPRKTNTELQQACDSGNPIACDELGMRHLRGDGTAKDSKKAAALFERACDGGDAQGCFNLGESYGFGDGVTKSAAQAVSFYQRACDGSEPLGCAQLAIIYAGSLGVPKDHTKTAIYADRACTLKNQLGCALLGLVYAEGVAGYAKDTNRAEKLLDDACWKDAKFSEKPDAGSRVACPALVKLTGEPACVTHTIAAADASGVEIRRHCYDEKQGWATTVKQDAPVATVAAPPVDQLSRANIAVNAGNAAYAAKDYTTAAARYAEGCDYGSVSACGVLGEMYVNGTGVSRNGARAAAPLAKACDGGITASCGKLGVLFDSGNGVSVNKARAFALFNGACSRSDMSSCYNLGRLYESGQGAALNVAQAAALYQRACNAKVAEGCTSVGRFFADGIFYPRNEEQAKTLLTRACLYGDSEGCNKQRMLAEDRVRKQQQAAIDLQVSRERQNGKSLKGQSVLAKTARDCLSQRWAEYEKGSVVTYDGPDEVSHRQKDGFSQGVDNFFRDMWNGGRPITVTNYCSKPVKIFTTHCSNGGLCETVMMPGNSENIYGSTKISKVEWSRQ